jgi:phenylalanyl-tRNA synthetase beta chain
LKKRLELIGCRSVNNIVDITNYIQFSWGEPLHAFDLNRLSADTIFVRRAKQAEKLVAIDGIEMMLNSDTLIIADREKPIAIAGVMGSKDTEVIGSTKDILLEAAVFNPIIVRRARQSLGLQSESAYRFERGVNPDIVQDASWEAVRLIQETCGGICVLAKKQGSTKAQKRKIKLDALTVHKILGIKIALPQIKVILNRLGFKVTQKAKDNLIIETPAHRPDVKLEIDLIEEVARIFGFARIPQTLPRINPRPAALKERDLVSLIKDTLAAQGSNEVITYSLIDKEVLEDYGAAQAPSVIEILNPLSKEQAVLRPTVIPGLLSCVASNLNQKQEYINIFEIAKLFSAERVNLKEELVLGMAICGRRSLLLGQGLIKEEVGLLHLKGVIEFLFERLGVKDYDFSPTDNLKEIDIIINKQKLGLMRSISRSILEKFDIKNKDVFVAELLLDKFLPYINLKKKFLPLPLYPSISRDISFIIKENIKTDDILQAIRQKGGPLLKESRIVDYYKGKQIPSGFRGLTVSCLYRSEERTLTEAEINPTHSLICAQLADKFGAKIR